MVLRPTNILNNTREHKEEEPSRRRKLDEPRRPTTTFDNAQLRIKYARDRRKRPTECDRKGDLYLLKGRLRRKTFFKVGRSVDVERRLEEHKKQCRAVTGWEPMGHWTAKHHHKAEKLVHQKMKIEGFRKFDQDCPCEKDHQECFVLRGTTLMKGLATAEGIIRHHLKL
ncbi:hypothetical protein V5O48_005371 [Marasmius crinis-equi]|uniref:Bacteriophage T5 Orf172 DNA-binding domain-containing protein n=1 Tax=Marasmius crinis-equi TaxID=585013 RepID=A0ABR3FMR5_9AGAR